MKRFWEIDFLRGFAIINMIIFNYAFTLKYLGIIDFDLGLSYAVAIASTFIFISGVSMTFSYNRKKYSLKKFSLRGLELLGWGAIITLITFFAFPEAFIVFGILHFIGLSVLIGQFFLRFVKLNIILASIFFVTGLFLLSFSVDFPWLVWLGLAPEGFYTLDYFPFLPWFGLTLLGISAGNSYYPKGKRNFAMPDLSDNPLVKAVAFLGRNSLRIYLLHQPLLIVALVFLGFITL